MVPRSPSVLTPRQIVVARLAASGKTDREIAEVLELSRNTVRTHMKNIFVRLEISSREELPGALEGH